MPDFSFYEPSKSAERTFRRLRVANIVVLVLLGFIALLAIWNVVALVMLSRGEVPDLADVRSVRSHISARLVTWVTVITLGIFIFKEWRWGERSIGMVYFLLPLLFLWLVPVMSAEVEPQQEAMQIRVTLNYCGPGAVEDGMVGDTSLCLLVPPSELNMYMATSDPIGGDPEWLAPDDVSQIGASWNVEARGNFRVYFMLEQESVEQCTSAHLATTLPPAERDGHQCLERDGQVWMMLPFETSTSETGRLTIYQEAEP